MTEVVNFRMNSVIKDSFKKVCKSHNMSMSSRINDLIIEFMKDFKIEDKKEVTKKTKKVIDWRDKLYVS
tara:strand:- start:483 stop:689 length:207 start_codon:yes stop_codon:yes gene_type:complete